MPTGSSRHTSDEERALIERCRTLSAELRLPVDPSSFESAVARRRFVADLLVRLPASLLAWRDSFEDLTAVVISVVREHRRSVGSGWPDGQPGQVFGGLIQRAVSHAGGRPVPPEVDAAVEALHVFLAELGHAGAEHPAFLADQRLLIDMVIDVLRDDLPLVWGLGRRRGRAVRLAEMLAQDYSLIRGADERRKSIMALQELVEKVPEHYADPFIQDLLIVYRKMNLRGAESKRVMD